MTGTKRTAGGMIGGLLLNVAAFAGFVCIVLVLLATFFQVTLIMFKTGSMSPTIPAGSLAVVHKIPASDIAVGDVLTVDRPGMLPVTHRVTSVEGAGDGRTITMKGDANDAEDPSPYTVTEARRVIVSVPYLAHVVLWFANPWVLGGLTVGASVLVTWAFWPRESKRVNRDRNGGGGAPRHGASEQPDDARPDADEGGNDTNDSPSRVLDRVSAATAPVVGAVLAVGALACAPTVPAQAVAPTLTAVAATVSAPARSEPAPVVTRGAHITLTSIGDADEMASMRPGVPVLWQIGVRVDSLDPGAVQVSLESAGSQELGLELNVRGCSVRWSGDACSGVETPVGGDGRVEIASPAVPVAELKSTEEQWYLVKASIPAAAPGAVALTMRAAGGSDVVSTSPGPIGSIPVTGADASPMWLLGVGGVGAGLGVAGVAAFMRRRRSAGDS